MIGIVGGVGPYAGLALMQNIFDQTLANKDQDHLDVAMFNLSSKILDRTEFLLGEIETNPGYAIAEVLLKLESAGARVAGIPCNTAHADEIMEIIRIQLNKAESNIELLSLINSAIQHTKMLLPDVKQVGVLSTTGTNQFGIYQKALEKGELQCLEVPRSMQENTIHPAIYDSVYGIKAKANPVTKRARNDLLSGIDYLAQQGAEVVIKGCTEIALAVPENEINGTLLIDPSIALARALIQANHPEKLKPIQQ